MSSELTAYWTMPPRWRRWPKPLRWITAAVAVGASLGLAALPLCLWWPQRAWKGLDGFAVLLSYMAFRTAACCALALAGATTLAGEREKGTWEALLLTPSGARAIVRAKLLGRTARCAGLLLLTLPFWLAWGAETLVVNEFGPFDPADTERVSWLRLALFLAWLSIRTVGSALPMVALGVAISARCVRVRTALTATCAALIASGTLLWAFDGFGHRGELFSALPWLPEIFREVMARFALWPILPNEFTGYEGGLLPTGWAWDLAADLLWMVILPWLLYRLAVRWSLCCPQRGVLYRGL